MSEVNPTPEELVETINYDIDSAEVIPTPIDPTLSIEGEAADAKATGDAIAAVVGTLRINGKLPVNNAVTLYGGDILLSNAQGAQTIAEAITAAGDKAASDIMYDSTNMISVGDALTDLENGISEEDIDEMLDEVFGEGE